MMKHIKQYQKFEVFEQYSGSKRPGETLLDFVKLAKKQGATTADVLTAIHILIDQHYGKIDFEDTSKLPKFKKDSGVAIALRELENGINSSFEDGYSMDWIHSDLSGLVEEISEMAILPRDQMPDRRLEIDLSSPDGNVFSLMALAKRLYPKVFPKEMKGYERAEKLARKLNMPKPMSPIDILIAEMQEGDYENAINAFDRKFGAIVTLYR